MKGFDCRDVNSDSVSLDQRFRLSRFINRLKILALHKVCMMHDVTGSEFLPYSQRFPYIPWIQEWDNSTKASLLKRMFPAHKLGSIIKG